METSNQYLEKKSTTKPQPNDEYDGYEGDGWGGGRREKKIEFKSISRKLIPEIRTFLYLVTTIQPIINK